MIIRKKSTHHLIALTILCLFQVVIEAQDNCNCVCKERSLNGNSVCQLLSTLVATMNYRTQHIIQLNKMKITMGNLMAKMDDMTVIMDQMSTRIEAQDKIIHSLTKEPRLASRPKRMDDLKKAQHDIRNLEKKVHNISSYVQRLDVEEMVQTKLETVKETMFKNDVSELRSKLHGVMYKNETKQLNERLDSVETKLSEMLDSVPISEMLKDLENFRTALKSINTSIHENNQSEEVRQSLLNLHSSKLKDLENLEVQVKDLETAISNSDYELEDIRSMVQNVEKKTQRMGKEFADLIKSSGLKDREWASDLLRRFKNELMTNCSKGTTPCFSLQNIPEPLHNSSFNLTSLAKAIANHNQPFKVSQDPFKSRFFHDCSTISLRKNPNLRIHRQSVTGDDEDRIIIFECTKNTKLVGPQRTECQNGTWVPDTVPKCVTTSTYKFIPECREIRTTSKLSLVLDVNERRKTVRFHCNGGKILDGSPVIRCINGTWFPNSFPKCVNRY